MLPARVFEPVDGQLLFHYCSGSTLHAIANYKKLRLSDFFAMNDFMEMHWGYKVWEFAAGRMLKEVGKEFLDAIDERIHNTGIFGLLVGCCFSLDGDVLSQWRAYADDGSGFAIGFNASAIKQLPIRMLRVEYDFEKQIEEVMQFIRAIHLVEQGEKEKFGSDFNTTCYTLAYDLAGFKNPGFREEQEVRIVHVIDFISSNSTLKLQDAGGHSYDREVKGETVQFRMKDNVPVAFIDIDFTDEGRIGPVKEVVLGPKNDAITTGISVFLETLGIEDVEITRSRTSHR